MILAEPPRLGRPVLDTISVLVALIVPCVWLAVLDRGLRRPRTPRR